MEENVNWTKLPEGTNLADVIKESIVKENPVDKDLDEMEKALGVSLNREKLLEKNRQVVLDFIESHNVNGDLSEEEIDRIANEMIDAVQLPAVIEQRSEIDAELGLKPEDLKSLYAYLSGKGEKPIFLDRYMADSENKLKDFQHVMTLIRLSSIPQLAALQGAIQTQLYSPANLLQMDAKDLATASANLSREMSDILNNAVKSIELMNSMGRVDSRYRAMMDKLLVVPEDVLNQIEHLLNNYQ